MIDRKTAAAVARYTYAGCVRAYRLNVTGEGACSIALCYNVPNVTTTRAADAAINAGRVLVLEEIAAHLVRNGYTAAVEGDAVTVADPVRVLGGAMEYKPVTIRDERELARFIGARS